MSIDTLAAGIGIGVFASFAAVWFATLVADERVRRAIEREHESLRRKAEALRSLAEADERRELDEFCTERTSAGEMCDNCPRDGRCDALPYCGGKERHL